MTKRPGIVAVYLLAVAGCTHAGPAPMAEAGPASDYEAPLPVSAAASEQHHCAIFGGSAGPDCDNYPGWTTGTWTPPPNVTSASVLIVGGGGGGGGSIEQGIGGNGGNSGEVVSRQIRLDGSQVKIRIGLNGRGGFGFRVPGGGGGITSFGSVLARGGLGGRATPWGFAPPSNGGGGAGGGFYQPGNHGGRGGSGGSGGTDGAYGSPGSDPTPVRGTEGGVGNALPDMAFFGNSVTPGRGGEGGAFGAGALGFGGGGGGGGGGILVARGGGNAASGTSGEREGDAQGGAAGAGYGAGGGGGGNFRVGAQGGEGATGVVYVEWGGTISQAPRHDRLASR